MTEPYPGFHEFERAGWEDTRIHAALHAELSAHRQGGGYELPMPALLATGHKNALVTR